MEGALIIDDDELICYAISRTLHAYYPEIKSVPDETKALEAISSCSYGLCFLDIALPGPNGLALLKKIRELSPCTKVVVMTGVSLDEAMRREIEECSFCFLMKPFDVSELKAVAQRALGRVEEELYAVNRQSKRIPARKTVNYSITVLELGKPISLTLKGDIVDMTGTGIGLKTFYPLEPGHLLVFTNGIEDIEHRTGIVKWSTMTDDSYMYRVGIEFIDREKGPADASGGSYFQA